MNGLEERLRDAYRAAAQTVPPDNAAAPRWRERIAGDEARPRRLAGPGVKRWLVPLAAAAAVVVAIGLVAVITGGSHGAGHSGGNGPVTGRAALAGSAPRFMVLVVEPGPGTTPGTASTLHVQVAATGRELATVPSPAGTSWTAVAATGNDQDFVLAANPPSGSQCRSSLYRLRLTGTGRVASLTPLSVPTVSGGIYAGSLRASADGQTVAYAAMLCPQTVDGTEAIGVISTVTGHATRWTMPNRWYMDNGSISLSADGRLIAVGAPNARVVVGKPEPSGPEPGVWLLAAGSAPGTVAQRGHEVVTVPRSASLGPVALSADGTQVYVNTEVQLSPKQLGDDLTVYSAATGARLRTVRTGWHALVQDMSTDARTAHAVFWDVYSASPIEMDLATGKITSLAPDVPLHAPIDDVGW